MHPVRHWRNFQQRYRLIGSQCSSCGARLLSPDRRCPTCTSLVRQERLPMTSPPAVTPSPLSGWRQMFREVSRFLRWQDWGPSKVPLISTVCFYLTLTYGQRSLALALTLSLAFVLFAASHSALAYVLNDWGDRFSDRERGKWNAFLGLSQRRSLLALGMLVLVAALSAGPFVGKSWFIPLWLLWMVAAASYSLPPLRLKEHTPWRQGVEILAQWVLPVCLAFAGFGHFGSWDMILYALVLAAAGTSLDWSHVRSPYLTGSLGSGDR